MSAVNHNKPETGVTDRERQLKTEHPQKLFLQLTKTKPKVTIHSDHENDSVFFEERTVHMFC